MEFKDYYKTLGVSANSDLKAIKTAYRKLARKYHPDVSKESDAEKKFKEVAEAFSVLKDKEKRAEYDEIRKYGNSSQGFNPPPGWNSSYQNASEPFYDGDMSEFFETLFGRNQQRANYNDSMRGKDIEINLPIFLEETLSDKPKQVSYTIPFYDQNGARHSSLEKN